MNREQLERTMTDLKSGALVSRSTVVELTKALDETYDRIDAQDILIELADNRLAEMGLIDEGILKHVGTLRSTEQGIVVYGEEGVELSDYVGKAVYARGTK